MTHNRPHAPMTMAMAADVFGDARVGSLAAGSRSGGGSGGTGMRRVNGLDTPVTGGRDREGREKYGNGHVSGSGSGSMSNMSTQNNSNIRPTPTSRGRLTYDTPTNQSLHHARARQGQGLAQPCGSVIPRHMLDQNRPHPTPKTPSGQLLFAEPISPPDTGLVQKKRDPGRGDGRMSVVQRGMGASRDERGESVLGSGSGRAWESLQPVMRRKRVGEDGMKVYGKRGRSKSRDVEEHAEDSRGEEDGSDEKGGNRFGLVSSSPSTDLPAEIGSEDDQELGSDDEADEDHQNEMNAYPSSEHSADQDSSSEDPHVQHLAHRDRSSDPFTRTRANAEPKSRGRGHAYELEGEESFRPAGWGKAGGAVPERMMRSVKKSGLVVETRSRSHGGRGGEGGDDSGSASASASGSEADDVEDGEEQGEEDIAHESLEEYRARPRIAKPKVPRQSKMTNFFARAPDPPSGSNAVSARFGTPSGSGASRFGSPAYATAETSRRTATRHAREDRQRQKRDRITDNEMVDMSEDSQNPIIRSRLALRPQDHSYDRPRPGPSKLRAGAVYGADGGTLPEASDGEWEVPDSQPDEAEVEESLGMLARAFDQEIEHEKDQEDQRDANEDGQQHDHDGLMDTKVPSSQAEERGQDWLTAVAASRKSSGRRVSQSEQDRLDEAPHLPGTAKSRRSIGSSYKRKRTVLSDEDEEGQEPEVPKEEAKAPPMTCSLAKRTRLSSPSVTQGHLISPRRTLSAVSPNARSFAVPAMRASTQGKENGSGSQMSMLQRLEKVAQDGGRLAGSRSKDSRYPTQASPRAAQKASQSQARSRGIGSDASIPATYSNRTLMPQVDSESFGQIDLPGASQSNADPEEAHVLLNAQLAAILGKARPGTHQRMSLHDESAEMDEVSPESMLGNPEPFSDGNVEGGFRVLVAETLAPMELRPSLLEEEEEAEDEETEPAESLGHQRPMEVENIGVRSDDSDSFSVGRTPSSPHSDPYEQTFIPAHIRLAHQAIQPGLAEDSSVYRHRRQELFPWVSQHVTPEREGGPQYLVTPDEEDQEDMDVNDPIETQYRTVGASLPAFAGPSQHAGLFMPQASPSTKSSPLFDTSDVGAPARISTATPSPVTARDASMGTTRRPSQGIVSPSPRKTPAKQRFQDGSETLMQWSPVRYESMYAMEAPEERAEDQMSQNEECERDVTEAVGVSFNSSGQVELEDRSSSQSTRSAYEDTRRADHRQDSSRGDHSKPADLLSRLPGLRHAWPVGLVEEEDQDLDHGAQSAPGALQRSRGQQSSLAQFGFFPKNEAVRTAKRVNFGRRFEHEDEFSEDEDDGEALAKEESVDKRAQVAAVPMPPPDPRLRPAGLRELQRREACAMDHEESDIRGHAVEDSDDPADSSHIPAKANTPDPDEHDDGGEDEEDDEVVPSSQVGEGDSFCSDFASHESDAGLDDQELQALSMYGWLKGPL